MNCPRCNSVLKSVEYDGQKVEVCPGCKGEWLFAGELQKIVEHHDEVFTPEEIASMDAVNKETFTAEKDDKDELNCPLAAMCGWNISIMATRAELFCTNAPSAAAFGWTKAN
jgi:hypothetical protein